LDYCRKVISRRSKKPTLGYEGAPKQPSDFQTREQEVTYENDGSPLGFLESLVCFKSGRRVTGAVVTSAAAGVSAAAPERRRGWRCRRRCSASAPCLRPGAAGSRRWSGWRCSSRCPRGLCLPLLLLFLHPAPSRCSPEASARPPCAGSECPGPTRRRSGRGRGRRRGARATPRRAARWGWRGGSC